MASSLSIIDVARVTPSSDSAESLTLPLTFFDVVWVKFHPVERVIFYRLTTATRPYFDSVIVPSLKSSLSRTLSHYLPLAGRLVLDSRDTKPIIVYSRNDAVSFTVAESAADFSHLSGDGPRRAAELQTLVPELSVSDDWASAVSFQVTLFPDQGFCMGVTTHHAVLDGKTATMFLKAWAHTCKSQQEQPNNLDYCLPEDLTPFYDRTIIHASPELEAEVLSSVSVLAEKFGAGENKNKPMSLKLLPSPETGPEVVRYTFELTREDIQTLRDRVKNESPPPHENSRELRLSTFVLAYSYAFTCMVKARGGDPERPVGYTFAVDCRKFSDPQIPGNYFGNCISAALKLHLKAEKFLGKNGFVNAARMLSDTVAELDSKVVEKLPEILRGFKNMEPGSQVLSVAGSTRFGVYGLDFGWGRPVKVEIVSINNNGAISMAESKDGSGGVEIGFSLKKREMDVLVPLLRHGLK